MTLYTELATKTPPEGKYESHPVVSSTTDTDAVVAATNEGRDTFTFETSNTETSEDGRVTSAATESEQSERSTLLARLEQAERDAVEELQNLEGLSEEAEAARQEAVKQMEGAGSGEQEAKQATATEPEKAAATSEPTNDYERVLSLAAEKGVLDATAETLDRFTRPDSPQLAAVSEVLAAVLRNETDPSEYAAIVHNLLSSPTTAGKLETAQSADEIVELVRNSAKWVREIARTKRLAEIKQRYAANNVRNIRKKTNLPPPGKPVGGTMRSSVPLDSADYQTYKREREKQIKAARGR